MRAPRGGENNGGKIRIDIPIEQQPKKPSAIATLRAEAASGFAVRAGFHPEPTTQYATTLWPSSLQVLNPEGRRIQRAPPR